MRPLKIVVTILGFLALISGYLLSKASLAGKAGISLFYKEYGFLKVWWQAALIIMILYIIFLLVQGIIHKRLERGTANLLHITAIIIAITGLYFTYHDFRETITHRILGERFHLGSYLFWFGWMLISIFYLSRPQISNHNEHIAIE